MTQLFDWQGDVGRKWARLHALTDRSFSGLTQQFLDRLEQMPADAILDVGCGAGELSLALSRLRPGARIVGVDVSADLVATAQHRAAGRGGVSFVLADAATWEPGSFQPDLVVSRHGVMFFPDPPQAFAHLRAIAAPGARLAFTCFRDRRLNPWTSELAALLPADYAAPFDPHAPGPFAFADDARVAELLVAAGWRNIRCEALDYAYVAGMGDDPIGEACEFFAEIGPAAPAIAQMRGTPAGDAFDRQLREWLAGHASAGLVAMPAAAWLVTATRD